MQCTWRVNRDRRLTKSIVKLTYSMEHTMRLLRSQVGRGNSWRLWGYKNSAVELERLDLSL